LGHARCGNLGSWQLGHSARDWLVSESCARRLEVRALEWRLFGFGMVVLLV